MSILLSLDAEIGKAVSRAHISTPQTSILLRQSGAKPLRINATLLAECTNQMPNAPAWHELMLFHCDNGQIALSLATCRAHAANGTVYHALLCDSLENAMSWLEAFDPTADLLTDIDAADRSISPTALALRATTLRLQADWVEMQYKSLLGELFYQLDSGI